MNTVEEAYNKWAETYDAVVNPTRDLDAKAMQTMLGQQSFDKVLELGCGTGKNTAWLATKARSVTAVDLSDEMLGLAREKIRSAQVDFIKADINRPWNFVKEKYHLVTFNLVLEHIENLEPVFEKAAAALEEGGNLFICELHPLKQYAGSKARFEKDNETVIVDCFTHHLTDYLAATHYSFQLTAIREWFDENEANLPRLISFLFKKRSLQ